MHCIVLTWYCSSKMSAIATRTCQKVAVLFKSHNMFTIAAKYSVYMTFYFQF